MYVQVAIIGGSTGDSLRETLKHKTVEEVVAIGVDMELIQTAQKYFPELCDCSNLVGSMPSCFDDPRVELVFEDAASWLVKNYGDMEDILDEDFFDAIIVDM